MYQQLILQNIDNEFNSTKNIYTQYLYSNEINPFFIQNYNNQICKEEIPLENVKNIMNESKINLIEDDDIDDEIDSIYIVKNNNTSKTELQSTDNSTKIISLSLEKNNSIEGKKETFFKKIINFETVLHHKRGRKEKEGINKKKKKKCHCSYDFDNIQRKIQVHFIKFLISLANDTLKNILVKSNTLYFKDIQYALKKIVNHNYIENLKQSNYADIIQMNVSPKNKKFEKDMNKKIFLKVCQKSQILKKIFDQKYLYIFQKYYYGLKNVENEINFDGIKINLSSKTKPFYHLLKKNEIIKEKFINVVNDVYFSDKNYLINKKFRTINCNE